MTAKNILNAMDGLDRDLIDDAERVVPKRGIGRFIKPVAIAAVFCLLAGAAVLIPKLTKGGVVSDGGEEGGINVEASVVIDGKDDSFTDEEGRDYLLHDLPSIISGLEAFGCDAEGATVAEHGYSHVNTGNDGNRLAVNFRDYLLYKDGKIIAIITVVKEGGSFHCTPSWGGAWFDAYTELLSAHKGDELVYLYVGSVEAIALPSGRIVTPDGKTYAESPEAYEYFKFPQNTYIP